VVENMVVAEDLLFSMISASDVKGVVVIGGERPRRCKGLQEIGQRDRLSCPDTLFDPKSLYN
jgi:hypothetical protein